MRWRKLRPFTLLLAEPQRKLSCSQTRRLGRFSRNPFIMDYNLVSSFDAGQDLGGETGNGRASKRGADGAGAPDRR
jgi:hypothetical protein